MGLRQIALLLIVVEELRSGIQIIRIRCRLGRARKKRPQVASIFQERKYCATTLGDSTGRKRCSYNFNASSGGEPARAWRGNASSVREGLAISVDQPARTLLLPSHTK